MGARIDVESAPGQGTTFRLLLPRATAAMDQAA
jgi:signal transduction histidine kinase